jgi:hypothetical protein
MLQDESQSKMKADPYFNESAQTLMRQLAGETDEQSVLPDSASEVDFEKLKNQLLVSLSGSYVDLLTKSTDWIQRDRFFWVSRSDGTYPFSLMFIYIRYLTSF